MGPTRRIRDIAVPGDQRVVEMKRIVEGRTEKQNSGQSQSSRHFIAFGSLLSFMSCVFIFRHDYMRVASGPRR